MQMSSVMDGFPLVFAALHLLLMNFENFPAPRALPHASWFGIAAQDAGGKDALSATADVPAHTSVVAACGETGDEGRVADKGGKGATVQGYGPHAHSVGRRDLNLSGEHPEGMAECQTGQDAEGEGGRKTECEALEKHGRGEGK